MKLGHSSSQLVMSIFPKMPTTNTLSETVIEVRGKKKKNISSSECNMQCVCVAFRSVQAADTVICASTLDFYLHNC